jgi:hypothetical protein
VTSTQVYIIERRPQPSSWSQFQSQACVSRSWCYSTTHVPAGVIYHLGRRTMASLLLRTRQGWLQRSPQRRLPDARSARAVAPCRADYQRPFDRLRCRLAGADFLEVFAAGRLFCAATASAGASSGNATAWGMISPAAVCGRLPNLMKRNAAAFCASNPRRAAVKVRASQGSIGCSPMTQCDASQSQPLLGGRVPTSAAN